MISRRTFAAALGGLAAVPFLPGILSRSRADEGGPPLRFYLMFTGNCQHPEHWIPRGGSTDFTLAPALAPLADFQDKLLLVHGLRGHNGHAGGMAETTTGFAPIPSSDGTNAVPQGGPSIDQLLAEEWKGSAPLRSLELGVLPGSGRNDNIVYSPRGLPIPAIAFPGGAFDKVFQATNEDPAVVARRREQSRSVLDSIAADLTAIEGRLGPSSRRLLDEHLTLVRERELELAEPFVPTACDLPARASGTGLRDVWTGHHRVLAAAFRCGVTRVATLKVGGWGGIEAGSYDEIGITGGHHNIAHGGSSGGASDLLAINRFHAEMLAGFLDELEAIPEGEGTMLDNTVVIWANELGLGAFTHSRDDVPVVIAGGAAAGLANGRYVNLGGVDYPHFLYTLTQALGCAGLDSFGRGNRVLDELMA
ncbi:MAG: DUF1552 domain-containing protein [Myxococcota bacterium]